MNRQNVYPNQQTIEDIDNAASPRSSTSTYDELNDMTLTPNKNNHLELEKVSTEKTEKYDVEHGGLETVEPVKTSKYSASRLQQ